MALGNRVRRFRVLLPVLLLAAALVIGLIERRETQDRAAALGSQVGEALAQVRVGGDPARAFPDSDPAVKQGLREGLEWLAGLGDCSSASRVDPLEPGQLPWAPGATHLAVLACGESVLELALCEQTGQSALLLAVRHR